MPDKRSITDHSISDRTPRLQGVVKAGLVLLLYVGSCFSVSAIESNQNGLSMRERMAARLVEQAQRALARDRLIQPAEDNAYDRLKSASMLDPNNPAIEAGMQAILSRYIEKSREARAAENWVQARRMLDRADIVFPNHEAIRQARSEWAKEQEALAVEEQKHIAQPVLPARTEFPLPLRATREEDPAVVNFLARIAQRLSDTDESVMIYARTDAEGRWIYKQMREAVPGYRIRGDIKISKRPRINLLAPLN